MDLIASLQGNGISIGVVTTSVSFYASAMLKEHGINSGSLVAWHDVRHPKPHPEGYLKCLSALGVAANEAIGCGDEARDAVALHSAGVASVQAAWNPASEAHHLWSRAANNPVELLTFL